MSNQQSSNLYGNQQQQQFQEQWNHLLQWQQWQQHFHQSSYQQPYFAHQSIDQGSQFTVPPPPPPESNDQPSTSSGQPASGRNSNSNNNFILSNSSNSRSKNNNKSNWRGNQRNRGNNRLNGNDNNKNQFNSSQNQAYQQQISQKKDNFQSNNFNEPNIQNPGKFNVNNNNRGRRNNWRNNRKNSNNQPQESSSSGTTNVSVDQNEPIPDNQQQTPEDIAFEEEFKKWEKQFQEWKNQNKNHPDKRQYQAYEKQFMEVREKLLSRREEMRKKKLQLVNTVRTPEQIAFENQWNNSSKSVNDNSKIKPSTQVESTILDPKSSSTQLPPPETSKSRDMSISAASILFGHTQSSSQIFDSFEKDDIDDFVSFDDSKTNKHETVFQNKKDFSIPGLEINPKEIIKEVKENQDVIDLDCDEDLNEQKSEECQKTEQSDPKSSTSINQKSKETSLVPIPNFRPKVIRNIVPISALLDEPSRSNRPEKIMIIIRGAPGSGKHYIANLIYEKEREKDNDRCKILSIDRYINGKYDPNQAESYNQALYAESRNLVREGYINFAIVILNECTIEQFNKISHTASSLGGYTCYSIEIHQKREVCEANNVNNRNLIDIINAIEDLDRYPSPFKITLIDPTSLLSPQKAIESTPSRQQSQTNLLSSTSNSSNGTDDFAQQMVKILQNEKVMQIIQAQLSNNSTQSQPSPYVMTTDPSSQQLLQQSRFNYNEIRNQRFFETPAPRENTYEEVPIFKPEKVIDYNHEHIPTFEEKLLEFKVFRIVEYNHKTTPTMKEFIKDIDLDKIVEKRKAVAMRKKILEYLRNAERPEDTVSNPKYPKNWEVIQKDRPPRKNKRKKKLTAKIKRILLRKSYEENSWMTKGYKEVNAQKNLDLEEISSEDDDDNLNSLGKNVNKVQIISKIPASEYRDEYEHIPKTIPNFNYFNNTNILDIKKLLWLPDRKKRPNKILIILRGASGSGKSHLVQLIKRKENEAGQDASNIRILCIDNYFLPEDDEDQNSEAQNDLLKSYLEEMQKHLKKTINDGLYNFIIIDADNCDLNSYMQFYQVGSSMNFAVYTIELYQKLEICIKQSKRNRSPTEIKNSIDLFSKSPTPNNHTLLIPSALYAQYDCFINTEVSKNSSSIGTYRKYLEQTIDNDKMLTNMPNFNWHNRDIMNITEILESPGRLKRSENIAILLRGPHGSGKEDLALMIIEKEKQYGNENVKFINIAEDYTNSINPKNFNFMERTRDSKVEKLMKSLRDVMRTKLYKFLIVDAETGDFSNYKQIHELVSSYQYKCYTIELYQDISICQQNENDQNEKNAIESVLEEMQLNPTPNDHILLNASIFYKQTSTNFSDRPLKSALKVSPNTSLNASSSNLQREYDKMFSKLDIVAKYNTIFNQRVKVNGDFIRRNEMPPSKLPEFNWFNQDIKEIREILDEPNRSKRSKKIVIFLRGAPGSGKTYLARLIERKEFESYGNLEHFKLLSIDFFFEIEKYREIGNQCEKYVEVNLNSSKIKDYMEQLNEKFIAEIKTNQHDFIIIEGNFCDLNYYNKMWKFANQNNFACYTIELNQDDEICLKYNDHKWENDFVINYNKMMRTFQTPTNHSLLDPEMLYHEYNYEFKSKGAIITIDESMDISDISDAEDDFSRNDEEEDEDAFETKFGKFIMSNTVASKWDDVETPDINRLDGTMKKSENFTMKDYLQSDEWSMRPSNSGKKRVRWADIEEKKAQDRMRSIGFIVGMTDWNRMTDDSDGRNALERTKYIEPRKKS